MAVLLAITEVLQTKDSSSQYANVMEFRKGGPPGFANGGTTAAVRGVAGGGSRADAVGAHRRVHKITHTGGAPRKHDAKNSLTRCRQG